MIILLVLVFIVGTGNLIMVVLNHFKAAKQSQLIGFEGRAAEANKTLADFLIKLAEQSVALDKRLIEVDKRLGDELLANAEDFAEMKTHVLRILDQRNLVEVDRSLEDYVRYSQRG